MQKTCDGLPEGVPEGGGKGHGLGEEKREEEVLRAAGISPATPNPESPESQFAPIESMETTE